MAGGGEVEARTMGCVNEWMVLAGHQSDEQKSEPARARRRHHHVIESAWTLSFALGDLGKLTTGHLFPSRTLLLAMPDDTKGDNGTAR